jgi:catechol 2,3-dioxygenase-like lactoylglutathione lyase family enzyme
MSIRSVLHTAISTADLDASVAFWSELGFVETRRWEWPRGVAQINTLLDLEDSAARAALMEGHGTGLELFEFVVPDPGAEPPPVHRLGYTHMAFSTDDLRADMDRLGAAGMAFWADPVTDPSGRQMVYGRSPEGFAIELVQHGG